MTSNVDMLIFVFEDSCRIQLKMSLQLKLNYLGMGHKSLILARCMIVPLLEESQNMLSSAGMFSYG